MSGNPFRPSASSPLPTIAGRGLDFFGAFIGDGATTALPSLERLAAEAGAGGKRS